MDAIETILNRKSIRHYTNQKIKDETLQLILKAGMSGPSCTNARDWQFIVVRDKNTLLAMAEANGRPAKPLENADVGILICGDLEKAFKQAKDYWVIDAAIAAQNMTLAAHALGIGSVWLGTWPQTERVQAQSELFKLPPSIIPHSILAFGYPDDPQAEAKIKPDMEENKIHYEKW